MRDLTLSELLAETAEEDYLASLWETAAVGVVPLRERRPEVLVFGDSHAYSGLDYLAIARAFPGKRLGACTFPAAFLESFDLVQAALEAMAEKPETLFFATSPRMFMIGSIKAERLSQHRDLLFDQTVRRRYERRWNRQRWAGDPAFGRSASELDRLHDARKEEIEQLEEEAVTRAIDAAQSGSLARWRSLAPDKTFTPDIEQKVESLRCWLQGCGVRLFVVHIPESPFAEALITETARARYRSLLDRLSYCGPPLQLEALDYGLGNRYFLNRAMTPDFDYSPWAAGRPLEGEDTTGLFDPDHMNLIGARRFTQAMLQRFGLADRLPSPVAITLSAAAHPPAAGPRP